MIVKDQLPACGCSNCGAYDGETQSILWKRLVWDGSNWLCRKCIKEISNTNKA